MSAMRRGPCRLVLKMRDKLNLLKVALACRVLANEAELERLAPRISPVIDARLIEEAVVEIIRTEIPLGNRNSGERLERLKC